MGVVTFSEGGATREKIKELHETVKMLSNKVDKILRHFPDNKLAEASNDYTTLRSEYRMVWWKKVDNAFRYQLRLIAGYDADAVEIDIVQVERNCSYYVFKDLPRDIYFKVILEPEDRSGEIMFSLEIEI